MASKIKVNVKEAGNGPFEKIIMAIRFIGGGLHSAKVQFLILRRHDLGHWLRAEKWMSASSVTRFGNFLHFGQPFKAGGNNYFTQITHIVRQFL